MALHPSWDDIEAAVISDPPTPINSHEDHHSHAGPSSRPSTWRSNDKDVTDLGQERLDDRIRIWKCGHCGKPVQARYKDYHKQNCDLARAIAENRMPRSVLEPDPNKRKRRLSVLSETPSNEGGDDISNASPRKKLTKKAARALEVEERKRVRLEKKARKEREAAEAKGRRKKGQPLDVNRQCGVINDNGQPCQRSLTCKTHAMGAKRAVPGRCKPYDELLLEWQKANNPAFLAKLEKKEEERAKAMEEKRLKKLEKKKKKDAAAAAAAGISGSKGDISAALSAALGPGGKKLVIGPDGQAGTWLTNSDGTKTFLASNDPNATATHPEALTSQFANDLFAQSVDSPLITAEVQNLLGAVRKRYTQDKLLPQPLVPSRTYHGMYTSQARRFLMMRQAFGTGSHTSSSISKSQQANGTSSVASSDGRLPQVAGGGWGTAMFASHS